MTTTDLDFGPIFTLIHRLLPIIILWFFICSSVLNGTPNGGVFIGGLFLTSIICIIIGAIFRKLNPIKNGLCFIINLTGRNEYLSGIPLSLTTITYTFFYLLYPIVTYDNVSAHLGIIMMFPILILFESFWLLNNSCANIFNIFLVLILIYIIIL